MLIILEGPRNSGKTTAVQKLQAGLGEHAYIIKFQRTSKPTPPIFMTNFLTKNYLALIDSRSIAILDRFHLTEYVMRTLDKKVDAEVLSTTTHMIDVMLKNIGAITYVLDTPTEIRHERLKLRDLDHNKREWPSYSELDTAWKFARKVFKESHVKTWPGSTQTDIDKLVIDATKYCKGGKFLSERIPLLPPMIRVDEPILVPA